jgi:hypothetical protein
MVLPARNTWGLHCLAGLRGFELPEDDSPNSHQLPEKGAHNVSRLHANSAGISSRMDETPSGGSNPLSPGIRAGLAALVGRAACANCDSATILMGEVMLQQHETIVAPEHPISDKKGRDAKRPKLERTACTYSHPFVDGAAANGLTE